MARPDIEADADAAQLAFDRSVRRYEWRRLVGWLLLALGGLMAVVHLLSRLICGCLHLPRTLSLATRWPACSCSPPRSP